MQMIVDEDIAGYFLELAYALGNIGARFTVEDRGLREDGRYEFKITTSPAVCSNIRHELNNALVGMTIVRGMLSEKEAPVEAYNGYESLL